MVKRKTKLVKKKFKSRIICSTSNQSQGISTEDLRYLMNVLSFVLPIGDKHEGYFEGLEKNLSGKKIEKILFYAGYGMELELEIEDQTKSSNSWQAMIRKEYQQYE